MDLCRAFVCIFSEKWSHVFDCLVEHDAIFDSIFCFENFVGLQDRRIIIKMLLLVCFPLRKHQIVKDMGLACHDHGNHKNEDFSIFREVTISIY